MPWLNVVLILFALLNIGGGIGAYATVKSVPSLVYALSAGALLLIAVFVARSNVKVGYGLATAVTVALIALFIKRYMDTEKVMPALGLAGMSVVVLICLIVGHFAYAKNN